MFPGITSRLSESVVASATSIEAKSDLVRVTGSTTIQTIVPHFGGGFSGVLVLVATDGSVGLGTSGNIAAAVTMAQYRAVVLVYSKEDNTWYPGAIS